MWKENESPAMLYVNDKEVEASVTVLNAEQSPDGESLATRCLMTPAEAIGEADHVSIVVSGELTSYAGVSQGEDLIYDVKRQPLSVKGPESVTLLKSRTEEFRVSVLPASISAGQTLNVEVHGDAVTAEVVGAVDDEGGALVRVTGVSGGTARLSLAMAGMKTSAEVQVICVDVNDYTAIRLPEGLTYIGAEAFSGTDARVVIVPESCERIDSGAFANCDNLLYLMLPDGKAVDVSEDAYDPDKVNVLTY